MFLMYPLLACSPPPPPDSFADSIIFYVRPFLGSPIKLLFSENENLLEIRLFSRQDRQHTTVSKANCAYWQAYIYSQKQNLNLLRNIQEVYDDLKYESLTLHMGLTWILWTWESESLNMYAISTTGPHLNSEPRLIRNSFFNNSDKTFQLVPYLPNLRQYWLCFINRPPVIILPRVVLIESIYIKISPNLLWLFSRICELKLFIVQEYSPVTCELIFKVNIQLCYSDKEDYY